MKTKNILSESWKIVQKIGSSCYTKIKPTTKSKVTGQENVSINGASNLVARFGSNIFNIFFPYQKIWL